MIECIKSIIWICSWNIGVVPLQIRHRHSIRWASAPQCKFKYNYRIQTLAIICTRYSALIAYFIAFTLAFLRFGAQFYEAHSSRLNVRTCEMQCVIDAFDSSIIHRCDFCVFSSVHMWCDAVCVFSPLLLLLLFIVITRFFWFSFSMRQFLFSLFDLVLLQWTLLIWKLGRFFSYPSFRATLLDLSDLNLET